MAGPHTDSDSILTRRSLRDKFQTVYIGGGETNKQVYVPVSQTLPFVKSTKRGKYRPQLEGKNLGDRHKTNGGDLNFGKKLICKKTRVVSIPRHRFLNCGASYLHSRQTGTKLERTKACDTAASLVNQ